MNIYEHIADNRNKTIVIVALFPLILLVLMYATVWLVSYFMYVPGTEELVVSKAASVTAYANMLALEIFPYVILFAFAWIFISYYSGDQIMLNTAGANEISRDDNPQVYSVVENIAKTAGLPMPRVFIVNDESSNAFATGRDPQHSAVVFTTGIIKTLNRSELEGVTAHEMSHIGNRDIRLMMIVITGIGIMTFLGQILIRFGYLASSGRSRKNGGAISLVLFLLGIVFLLYGVVIAPLVMFALSRRREYQADASAALLTRNPAGLASALDKISRDSRVEVLDSMPLMSSACIANASGSEGLSSFLSGMFETHPPIEKRIQALHEMDGRV